MFKTPQGFWKDITGPHTNEDFMSPRITWLDRNDREHPEDVIERGVTANISLLAEKHSVSDVVVDGAI